MKSVLMNAVGFTVFAATLGLPCAFAQSEEEQTSSGTYGDQIIVTARKRAENLQDVPESITVFTSQTIEDARIRRIDDFIQMTPGFEIHNGESAGVFRMSIRGVTQTNQGDAPVAMVVDGVTLPYANSFGKALFDIEQIEVLKGPQGSLYGNNAIGGAVLITTKEATDELEGRLTGSYGSYDTSEIIASLSGPLVPGRVLFRAAGYISHTDGDTRYAFFPDKRTGRQNRQAARADLTFLLSDNLKVVIGGEVGHTFYGAQPLVPKTLSAGAGIPGVTTDQINDNIVIGKPSQTSPDLPRTKQDYWDVTAKVDYDAGPITITSVSAYQSVDEPEWQDLDVTHIPFVYGKLTNKIEAFSQELRVTSRDDQRLRWVLGGFMQNVNRDYNIDPVYANLTVLLSGDTDPANAVYIPLSQTLQDQDLDSYAVFGQADFDVTDRLQLTLGARYDIDPRKSVTTGFDGGGPLFLSQKETFRQFQPKGSIRYTISPDVSVYATAARGFRPGGFNSGANANVVPAFPAESTTTYELGTKSSLFDGLLNVSLAGFYTDYRNQQLSLVSVSVTGASQDNFTVEKTAIKGAELEFSARPTPQLTLTGGASYIRGIIKEFSNASLTGAAFSPAAYIGNDVPLVSKYAVSGAAQYVQPLTAVLDGVLRIDVEHKGPMYWEPDNVARRSPYTQVDASMAVRGEQWELRAYAENVFDVRYDTLYFDNVFVQAPGGFDFAYISDRARYGLEATVRF